MSRLETIEDPDDRSWIIKIAVELSKANCCGELFIELIEIRLTASYLRGQIKGSKNAREIMRR